MRVEFGMADDAVPLADAHVALAALALEGLGFVLVALDARDAQAAVVRIVVGDVRRVDHVVVQAGGEAVAQVALVVHAVFLRGRRSVHEIVPALAADLAGRERTYRVPGRDDVALLRRVVAVVADLAARVLLQRHGVVEQHQRVQRRFVVAAFRRRAGLDEP